MATLFDLLKAKMSAPRPQSVATEEPQMNPLAAKVGTAIRIAYLDYHNLHFMVTELQECVVDAQRYIDYILVARPIGEQDVTVRLRVFKDRPESVQVFRLFYEQGFDEGIKQAAADPTGEFIVERPELNAKYWRVGGVKRPHTVTVRTYRDENGDGIIQPSEIASSLRNLYDFSRATVIETVEMEEFFNVEINQDDGWISMFIGYVIPANCVEVF